MPEIETNKNSRVTHSGPTELPNRCLVWPTISEENAVHSLNAPLE